MSALARQGAACLAACVVHVRPASRVLSCSRRAGLQYVLSEDGCALAGLLVGGERVGDAAGRGDRVHLTVAALNAPERSTQSVRRVHFLRGGHVHASVNAPLCAFRVCCERRRHGLVVERDSGRFVAKVAIDTVAVHALTVCVAELCRVDEGDAPRADLLAGHAHVLAAVVVANRVKVVNDIHVAVAHEVSVQCLVDEAGDATVDDDGVTVRVVVCLGDSLGLIVISSQVERFVQLAGLAVPVRLVNVAVLRDVDCIVGDHVGVAARTESRVPVTEVGEGGLDGFAACLVAVAGGLVADGEGAGGGSVVNELLLGGGGLLLHRGCFSSFVCWGFPC